MTRNTLDRLLGGPAETPVWEDFHEASKTSELEPPVESDAAAKRMISLWPSLPYEGRLGVALPPPDRLDMAFTDAVAMRETAHDICAVDLSLTQIATLFHHACGETHDKTRLGYPRKFRATPSGGAMYPLEVYLHSNRIVGVEAGIYHYNPCEHILRRVIGGDHSVDIGAALVQPRLGIDTGMQVFITAASERSTFKYGERGYRFALLEAGHVAQNLVLAATSMGLGAVTIGGYFDRLIDGVIGLDGIDQSTVYVVALGGRSGVDWL